MRVLVTGVTGQIGGALFRILEPSRSAIAASRKELDLVDPGRIAASLDRIGPDLIVNPAAYTAVDRAEEEKELAFRVNAEAPGVIAHWAAAREVPLIHLSTDYVFDGHGTQPWREDDQTRPLSIYGASKLAGEQAVRTAGGVHLIVRTSWVYAASGSNFLRTIARLAKERRELTIVADQIGAPTSARVIADAIARIIGSGELPAAQFAAANGTVNVAASGETSWHGFAMAIVEGLRARGVPLAVETITPIATKDYVKNLAKSIANRPANSRLDLTRLNEVFHIRTLEWDRALAPELDQLANS
jgi:dTDP-4-dehydrorhamnose reductase